MELTYNRGKVLGFGLFVACVGVMMISGSLMLEANTNARGVRTLVATIGSGGAEIVLCAAGFFILAMALSTLRLAGKNALAVRITKTDIEVRHPFGSPLLEWSEIRSIGIAPLPMAKGKRGLIMTPNERFASWHVLKGNNVTLPLDLLDLAEGELEGWLLETLKRPVKPARKRSFSPVGSLQSRARTFGRKT